MKLTYNLKLLLFFLLILSATTIFAQHNPILANFTATENKGKVYLSWNIVSGSTCNGIQIYSSTDTVNYTPIGSIAGICGSSSAPISYSFTDIKPEKNKINFYRLELGNNGLSEIISVEIIDLNNNGYQIRPSPVIDKAKIYFNNDTKIKYQLSIYNLNSILIFAASTQDSFFEINTENFHSGIYLFTIATEGNLPKVVGKFMVQ